MDRYIFLKSAFITNKTILNKLKKTTDGGSSLICDPQKSDHLF
jgi:hypothetical protein